jgi:hypothetical protein
VKSHRGISWLFYIGAAYDAALGIAFLFFAPKIFEWWKVTPPNHMGYVQFPGALLLVFALMFVVIARNPFGNRNLIPYGILLKVSYCAVVCWHWLLHGVPDMWKPLAVLDAVLGILFLWAYVHLRPSAKARKDMD